MRTLRISLLAVSLIANGCSDDSESSDGNDGSAAPPATFQAQVELGMTAYGSNCARCHGASGEGSDLGPAVVGPGTLPLDPPPTRVARKNQFRTALDVFEFASVNMPADAPGTVETQTLINILAFDLFANGVMLEEPLSAANAGDIVINP